MKLSNFIGLKFLFLILLAVVCLAGCATAPFVSAPPPNPPGDQVKVITHSKYRFKMYGEMLCDVTVKNYGKTDVKNITFLIDLGNSNYKQTDGTIEFLPSMETVTHRISTHVAGFNPTQEENAIKAGWIVINNYDLNISFKFFFS